MRDPQHGLAGHPRSPLSFEGLPAVLQREHLADDGPQLTSVDSPGQLCQRRPVGLDDKEDPPVLGRPASSGGSTTETSTPPGLRSAQERRRISPPTRSKITSISPATSLKRRRSVSINSSAPSPRTRSSAHARPVATTWAPALRAS